MSTPDITVTLQGLDEAKLKIEGYPHTCEEVLLDPHTLLEIGTAIEADTIRHFDAGGLPVWPELSLTTIARKMSKRGGKSSHIMVDLGTLRQSLKATVQGDHLVLTSMEYLKYHQWGVGVDVDGHSRSDQSILPQRSIWPNDLSAWPETMAEVEDIVIDALQKKPL